LQLIKKITSLLAGLALSACNYYVTPDDPRYAPVVPDVASRPSPQGGSLYSKGARLSLFEDVVAKQVGDIITVQLVESTQAKKDAKTDLTKNTTQTLGVAGTATTILGTTPQFDLPKILPLAQHKQLGNPLDAKGNPLTLVNINGQNQFKGEGDVSQNNQLNGSMTVTVSQILPNGNLVVRGEKWITLNQGSEYVRLTGTIRPQDIDPTNSILSTRIANARITYSGTGALAETNSLGWMSRFFMSPLWPF